MYKIVSSGLEQLMAQSIYWIVVFLAIIICGIFYMYNLHSSYRATEFADFHISTYQPKYLKPEMPIYFPKTSFLKGDSLSMRDDFNTSFDWKCANYRWQGSFNVAKEDDFQRWLELYQNDCHRPKCDLEWRWQGGIGWTIASAVLSFGRCLAKGGIFVGSKRWKWAEGPPRCKQPTFECYKLSTTKCTRFGQKSVAVISADNYTSSFQPRHTSPCALAAEAEASLLWVYGQLAKYLLRPDEEMELGVAKLRGEVMTKVWQFSKKPRPRYIAVHWRGGKPDHSRKIIGLDRYWPAIEVQANVLARSGIKIDFVYLSGDSISTRINVSELNRQPYWSYKFVTPNFIDTGPGEVEHFMDKTPAHRERLVTEYQLDLEMYTEAEAFIGVHSNVFALVYPMRVASNRTSSCMFRITQDPPMFYCDYCDPEFWMAHYELSC